MNFGGMFGVDTTRRKRGQHGPRRPGGDRLQSELATGLRHLRKQNPRMYEKVIAQHFGIEPEEKVGELERVTQSLALLRTAGLIDDPKAAGKAEGGPDWAGIAMGVAAAFLQAQQAGAAAAAQQHEQRPPPAAVAAPSAPDDSASFVEVPTPRPSGPPGEVAASSAIMLPGREVPGPCDPRSRMAIDLLYGKTPAEAASVILSSPFPQVRAAIVTLCATPDDEVVAYLDGYGRNVPHLAGLCRWLTMPEHQPWTLELARELRRRDSAA